MTRVVICCGSGGVGKTTTAAAFAVRLAREGHRVAVLTIDPARRLADALDIGEIGNTPRRVPLHDATGFLDAMMLDPKQTFDGIIARSSPNPDATARILQNHYYRFVSTRLAGAHEYMAMEKLFELATEGNYDVVVLDTPPTRHALDFLAAPDRLAGLMDEGVMRWLVLPASTGGWRMIEMGSEVLAKVLKTMLGERTIGDIAEFFAAFQGHWGGFRERSLQVRAMLRAPSTRFVLVTAPAPGTRAEALEFLDVLRQGEMPFAGFLVNRCARPPAFATAPTWPPAPAGVDEDEYAALLGALSEVAPLRRRLVAAQDASLADLEAHAPEGAKVWKVPEQDEEVHDLAGLIRLGAWLPALEELGP